MKIVLGDLTDAKEDLILHQVNCQNVMGSGVAKALYTKWPWVKAQYHVHMNSFGLPEQAIGSISIALVGSRQRVINCHSQLTFGTEGRHTNYLMVAKCFLEVNMKFPNATIAIPYLYGCGLGGGDWGVVKSLIEDAFGDRVTIYKLEN